MDKQQKAKLIYQLAIVAIFVVFAFKISAILTPKKTAETEAARIATSSMGYGASASTEQTGNKPAQCFDYSTYQQYLDDQIQTKSVTHVAAGDISEEMMMEVYAQNKSQGSAYFIVVRHKDEANPIGPCIIAEGQTP